MVKGHCRIKDGWYVEDSVCIRYPDGKEMEISASQYRDLRYAPPLDQLVWCD